VEKTGRESGKPYLSVKLNSPFLLAPVIGALMPQEDGSHILVWNRDDRKQARPPGSRRMVRGALFSFSTGRFQPGRSTPERIAPTPTTPKKHSEPTQPSRDHAI
jgi:hypothetical protein